MKYKLTIHYPNKTVVILRDSYATAEAYGKAESANNKVLYFIIEVLN